MALLIYLKWNISKSVFLINCLLLKYLEGTHIIKTCFNPQSLVHLTRVITLWFGLLRPRPGCRGRIGCTKHIVITNHPRAQFKR